jgi:hypothetical protein
MALNVLGLTTYTDENKMALIKKMVLGGRTLRFINVQPDIKSSATINILNSDLVAQPGSCGFNDDGETILTQQTLSVCPLKVNESICLDTLEQYYTQKLMRPGSYNEQIPFEELFASEKADKINALIDDLIWKGDTSLPPTNQLSLCDGFGVLASVTFSGSVVQGNISSATAITASNIIGLIDDVSSVVPTNILGMDDLTLFVGYDTYRTYALALRNANLFHYTGAENQGEDYSQMIPGTNIRVVAVRGLNGTNEMFLSSASNLYFGTDLLSDAEEFKIFYSADFDEVRFRAKWKQGVQFAFPDYVVYFHL